MDKESMMAYILDSFPYPVVFVDCDHIIRYMNKAAQHHYYSERGYKDLIGKSLLGCHNETSREKITAAFEKLKNDGSDVFLGVNKNQRIYMSAVRDKNGEIIGYFERFEMNAEK